jgi:hypothetical protein
MYTCISYLWPPSSCASWSLFLLFFGWHEVCRHVSVLKNKGDHESIMMSYSDNGGNFENRHARHAMTHSNSRFLHRLSSLSIRREPIYPPTSDDDHDHDYCTTSINVPSNIRADCNQLSPRTECGSLDDGTSFAGSENASPRINTQHAEERPFHGIARLNF